MRGFLLLGGNGAIGNRDRRTIGIEDYYLAIGFTNCSSLILAGEVCEKELLVLSVLSLCVGCLKAIGGAFIDPLGFWM